MSNFLFVLLFGISLFSMFGTVDVFAEKIILPPTDDAYVITDLSNPNDSMSDLNTGNMTMQKIWYSFDSIIPGSDIATLGYLKFDLSEINQDDVLSATLNMNSFASSLKNNTIAVFVSDGQDWSESSISFNTKPSFNSTPIGVIDNVSSTDWIQWDVTDSIKQHNSGDITLILAVVNFYPNSDEEIDLYSKESTIPNTQPFLEINLAESIKETESEYTVLELPVLEDAHVGANYVDLQGSEKMRNTHFGHLNSTIIWYSYNATGAEELFISSGYLKFDTSELNPENIISAKLKMYDMLAYTSGADRLISVFTVDDTTWTESELTFDNKPELVKKLSITQINDVNSWITWNVTDALKHNENSELTLAITYDEFILGHEEQTTFNSKESIEHQPYLEIVYDGSSNEGGGCLIATAAYGSELAPQVQNLRELRDNSLLQTKSGYSFMKSFNAFYYSFSPYIADLERENPIFKETVKLTLTPLLASLSILNHVDLDSEESVLGYGISLILLNVTMYFVAPAMLFWNIKNYIKKN